MDRHTFYRSDVSLIKKELQSYFLSGFLCDLKIVSGKSCYNVHRLMLGALSPFLSRLLSSDDKIEQIELSDFDELEVHSFIYSLYGMPAKEPVAYDSILKVLNISQKSWINFPSSIKEESIEIVPITYGDDNENGIDDDDDSKEYHDNEVENDKFIGHQVDDNNMLAEDDMVDIDEPEFGNDLKKKGGRPKGSVKKGPSKLKRQRPQSEPKPDQKPIQCRLCKIVCLTKTELFQHREIAHQLKNKKNEVGKFSCEHCGNLCGRRRDLLHHIKHSCPAFTLACSHCPRKFPHTQALDSHITRIHDPSHKEKALVRKKFVCPICGMELRKHVYEYHVASHDPQADLSKFEKFECDECGKKYTSLYKLTRHGCKKNGMVFDDNEGNSMCTLCLAPLKDKKDAITHKKEKHAELYHYETSLTLFNGNFACPYPDCDLTKRKISDIKIHLEMVHYRVKKSICEVCGDKFETSHMKKKHIIDVHKISSEFQCETCGLDCRSQYGLKNHNYLAHSGERRYKCKYCEKTFKRNSELKRHLFIHESHLSQNVCDVCGKAFRDISSLKAHVATKCQ